MTIDKTIAWSNSKGSKLVVTVALIVTTEKHNDDWLGEVEGETTARLDISAVSAGKAYPGLLPSKLSTNPALPAGYRKLGEIAMPAAQCAEFEAAVAELTSHPDYVAYRESLKAQDALNQEFAASRRKLNNTMTLNGRSY